MSTKKIPISFYKHKGSSPLQPSSPAGGATNPVSLQARARFSSPSKLHVHSHNSTWNRTCLRTDSVYIHSFILRCEAAGVSTECFKCTFLTAKHLHESVKIKWRWKSRRVTEMQMWLLWVRHQLFQGIALTHVLHKVFVVQNKSRCLRFFTAGFSIFHLSEFNLCWLMDSYINTSLSEGTRDVFMIMSPGSYDFYWAALASVCVCDEA